MPADAARSSSPALRLIRATTFLARLTGLLAMPRIGHGEALLLRPCASVHTCFMRYAIDVVYLDRGERIVKIVPSLLPWRLSFCRRAQSTLELAAGEAARLALSPGDHLAVD